MAFAPTLTTERLRLVRFGREHLTARYAAWLNDRKVVRYSEQRLRRHTLDTCLAYWRSFEGTPHYLWAIELAPPELLHIGNLNAFIDERNRTADLGILIGETSMWNQGFGREAWRAACQFLLNGTRTRKVTAGTLAPNKGMLEIMRATGMVEDGRRTRHVIIEGEPVDLIYAALFRDDVIGSSRR
jgi:RimJ/RimL family protein N-acetyltransferase